MEDGHSLAEQAVYEALWKAASPVDEPASEDRTVRIGYHRLAQMTRLSWVSVKNNLRSLEKKLAIEVTGSENSATREGKCYRVYSRSAILERREKNGLVWVRRSRGVELLKEETQALGRSRRTLGLSGSPSAEKDPQRASTSALDAEDQDQEETPIPGRAQLPTRQLILPEFQPARTLSFRSFSRQEGCIHNWAPEREVGNSRPWRGIQPSRGETMKKSRRENPSPLPAIKT